MKILTAFKVFSIFTFLLITNSVFSNMLKENWNYSYENIDFSILSVDGISPTSGHAGTVVTITGSGFTTTSNVLLETFPIPSANVAFVSPTQLQVTIPCGVASGFFIVDGIVSTVLFTYIAPTISTSLPNLSYCLGTTVPQIILNGTPTLPTTPSNLEFSWINTNTTIGLIGNGVGNLPTFTAVNSTLEPITSIVTITPSINGCSGASKSYTVTVNPLPIATPISNILVCAGVNINQINLTASSPTTGTGTSFSWNGNNNAAIGLSINSGSTSPIPSFITSSTSSGLLTSNFTIIPTYQTCIGAPINFTIQVAPSISTAPTIGTITQPSCATTTGSVVLSGLPIGNWTITQLPDGQTYINSGTTYSITNLSSGTYTFSVSNGTCSSLATQNVVIDAPPSQSIGGTLSISTAICSGQNSGLLSVSGYTGTIIRWEKSENNGTTWTPISNTIDTYTSGVLLVTTQYRVVVQNGVCQAVTSSIATITVNSIPVITDVSDQNVCYGDTVSFGNPVATPGYNYQWSSLLGITPNPTTSDYSFTVLQSDVYTFTITNATTGCSVSDNFSITMKPLPNATVISPTSICEGSSIDIGSNSTIGSTYSWTSIPSGFLSTNSNPSVNPAVTNTYILEETDAASGCKKSNQTVITVQPIPVITIVNSPQFNICETTTQVQLNASIANPFASFVWTKLIGSGSFDFTNILNPIYSPSTADVVLGTVTLRLSVIGANPCVATYTQDIVIIIDKKPIANAGLDVITCGTTPVQINATGTLNATNLVWSLPSGITGTLNLSNPYIPIFTPSANDVGSFDISLTASSNTTCPSASDTVTVLITQAPVVDAGPPTFTICEGSNYSVPFNPIAGQNIVNSTILWTKGEGDGTFSNINSLTPTYTPGVNDILNGSVTLTLSASGNNPCNIPATDSIILTIVKNPIVNAGADTLVCQGSINVNATIQNAGSILWTVQNGSGNFVDPTVISPIYIPAISDLNTTVTFSVAVTPINNCGPTVSDSVLYTINASPSVVAGGDDTICQSNATFQLQATVTNTTIITWTTTGSGSFDNINNEDPIYSLSPNDINVGSVTFTITGSQLGCPDTTDIMVLTIQKNPIADAGPAQVICQGDSVVIPGTAINSTSFNWVRNGGTGTFINSNTTNPTYSSQLSESGTIYLTLIADAIAPCTVPSNSNTTIDIIPRASADAGLDAQICEGATYQITTAVASNNIGVQWSTNGDGTFTGGSTISPIYTPGPSDNNNGTVVLTLVATKNFPCNANAVDQMTLTINKIPVITVINPDIDLCVGDPSYIISGVVPTNYDTLLWSTSGSGSFAPNTTSILPTYFPSASDYTLGTVTLTLTASRNPLNCNSSSYNTITLHFIEKPTVDAGPVSASICEGSFYVSNGAIAANYSNVTWSTSGSGTFTNATTFLAIYTPSALDYNLGFVNLTLTANPLSPCAASISDIIRLDLQKLPEITIRANDAICLSQNSYAIGGTSVTNFVANSQIWTSSGTGTFSPSGDALNPIYNPSTDDFAFGSVTLTITVNSISPCVIPFSKSFVLNFQKLPVANAGLTLVSCDTPFQITTATATLSTVSSLVWSTSGTGTFDYTDIVDPIYTPSTFDVQNSPITLTLTANAIAPCSLPSVTTLQLNIVKSPVITVTPVQATICEDATNVTVLGTTVLNESNYIWTSATGTIISNNTIQNPIVTPSTLDIINNQIVLTITAQPVAPCGVTVSKQVSIPIQKKPSVFAGTSQTICGNTIILTSDALSSNVTNLHWDNNGGDGIFTTSNLNTITEYTPGINEIANGQVLLTLIGDAIAPCSGTVTSTINYTIIKNPIVTINPTEVTICENQTTYTVPSTLVTLVNPNSILNYQWTTLNMASLTGASTWTPTYSPTAADIATGFVYLTLTVNPIVPCATPIIKTLKINFSKQATITFANDGFFCENISKPLSATFSNYDPASISWTIVNGTGSITGGNTATPTYVPASDSETVVIRISVASLTPCTNSVTQDFTITVVKKPIVSMTTITDIVCSSQLTYNLSGNTTQFANSILWTRENPVGTGTFSNATNLNPDYTFNAADIANGFVILRLTATSTLNCNLTDFKEIRINITKAPTVVTTPTDTVCQGSVFSASASATNNSSILWSTVGTSNGLFTNANQLVTEYTPGSNDINSFTIQVTAYGNAPCAAVTAEKTVTIQKNPIIDAGIENRYNCTLLPYQITGVTGQNLGSILWTSNSGSQGTFSNASSLNPSYTPSAAELSAGLPIILTITAQAVAPCLGSVSDFIILNLTPNQIVDAGTYSPICEGTSISLSGNVMNALDVNWTSSGTGTFSAVNSVNTDYVPSSLDSINGTVTLTLHATSNSNCPEVTDTTVITIKKKPIADAGANVSICQGSSYTLLAGDASAQNYSSITWTATGAGALNPSTINSLIPSYVPAIGQTGIVTLTLTANGYSECGINAVSLKTITIVPSPFATIPSTKTICEGETVTISNTDASAINFSSLIWSSSNGLGSFTPNNTAATIYTPASGQTGSVTLSLTANSSNGVCPSYVRSLLLDIIAKPQVEAGTNGTICQSQSFAVTGANIQNSTLYSWSVSGPATIQSGTGVPNVFPIIPPVIIPNAGASGTVTVSLTAVGTGICQVVTSDFLTIQINPIPVVNAGTDGTLCEGILSYQLNGTVSNANSYTWTTTGGGTILQTANPLAPLYIPSASDFSTSTGEKIITINLNATTLNNCSAVSDTMQLTLYAKPKINAGIDLLACQDSSSVLLNGATVSNYNSNYTVSWSSSGNGTWDFTNSNGGINPVYIFGSTDTSSVTLTMSVLPNSICPQVAVTDTMVITIHQNPTIVATSNEITMCGETFTLPDLVTINNGNSILWTNTTGVSGTPGVLTNATTETPIFTPSANEIANGFVLLTLTTQPLSGCSTDAVSAIKVNLQPKAIVNAGANITACKGEIITLNNGASVQNYTTYSWSENGTGTIVPATINTLNPTYTPGLNETGVITFTLQATNLLPCAGLVSQTMTVTISAQPTVNAGPDALICQNSNYSLGTASVANNTTVLWFSSQNSDGTSNGTYTGGTFSNTTIINPTYIPSQDDINLGYVFLTVRANSTLCNSLVSDVIKITISKAISVAAGSDATICEGTDFILGEATSLNAPFLVWTSSQNSNGTSSPTYVSGSFSSDSILNPIYTPSLDDINLGHVYLTLTGFGNAICPNDSSQILLNIIKKPTVSTTDVQMCTSTPQVALLGVATNYESINWSIYSGPGSISPNPINELNPTFISGISGLTTGLTTVVRLYVTPKAGCPQSSAVYDDLVITIQPLPSVDAGINGSVCYTSGQPIAPFAINGTSVTNASSQSWTSSVPGIFYPGSTVLYQSLSNICSTEILTLTANGNGACSTNTVSDTVTLIVNCSVPSLGNISGVSTICQGAITSYMIPTNSNIQSYYWSVPAGVIIQSGQGTNNIQVLYTTTANSGDITVTGTNGCGSVIATLPIIVNSLPTGVSISGPQIVCVVESNVVYLASTISNATSYTWIVPSGMIILSGQGTNSIQVSITSTATSGNVSVTGNNSCGVGTVSTAFPIIINSQPSLSSSLTPAAICSGTVFNYVPTSVVSGTTFAWTRATQSGISNPFATGSNTINETLVNTTTNAVSVSYQITTTSIQGCINTQTVIVVVNPAPSLTSVATPIAICSGSVFNYTPTSASIGTISWVRNAVSGILEGTSNGTGTINETLTNSTSIPISVTYLLTIPATNIGCTNSTPISIQVVVNPDNTVSPASSTPITCINTVLSPLTHITTGATGIGLATGLPSGVTALWVANTITISGTPTVSGIFNYSIPLIGGCSAVNAVGSITVNPSNTVTPASSSPSICINTVLTAITHITTGATGIGAASNLPTGITASWSANSITISGTPSASGTFNYSIPLSGGCGGSAIGTITVIPSNTVTPGSSTPTLCTNMVLTPITHSTTGATGIGAATGLPSGLTSSWVGNTIIISGAPTVSGIFNYSIPLIGGCSTVNATGSIIVNIDNTVTPASSSPTLCINTPLTPITHTTTVANGIGAATGLPSGVTALWGANTITISGTPSTSGTYNYSIPLIGGCSTVNATGTIIVNPDNTVTAASSSPIICINTVLTTINHSTSGASGIGAVSGLPTGVTASWSANTISISGTPTASGTFIYTIPLIGGCNIVNATGSITVNPSPMATISGTNNFVICQNGTQPTVTFTGSSGTAPYTFTYQISGSPIETISTVALNNSVSVSIPTSVFGNYTISLLSVQDSSSTLCSSSNITLPNLAFVEVQQMGTIIPVNQTLVSQIVCQGNPILPIIFTIGGASTNAYVTNLPTGLNGVYNIATRTLTISGTPSLSGVSSYVVHTSGSINGCNSTYGGTITVNSNDSITALTPATINQSVCSNAAIQSIVYSLGGGATGGIVTFSPNTPAGITWNISPNNTTITISGASNTTGTFTYTVQSFGLCGQTTAFGTITINNSATVALVSGNPSPTICSGTSFATPIQYSISSATATIIISGALPTGVTFNPVTGIISGTPTQSGSFPYTIAPSTGCGNVLSGVITVNPTPTISYVSGNTNQVACQYSSIDPINFIVSSGVNAITISPPLPAGISYSLSNGILTISGTPTSVTSLAQNFIISTQGTCGPQAISSVTFDIRQEATITLISGSGAINQAVCQSSAIVPIRFTIGGGASGIIVPTLPAGLTLTLDPLTGIYTIQGNPLVNGIFNFPITTTGCPKTVFITISNVNSAVGITLTSAPGTDNQTLCQTNFNSPIVPIVYTIIGATSVNIPNLPVGVTYVFSPTTGQLIISGTPLQAGIFNYTITSLPCSIVKAGVIKVSTPMFITNEVVTNVSCSSSNDGAISVTIVGGVSYNGLYAVHWSGPNGFQQNQTTITGLQAGDYVLTGTDAIGCPIPTMTYTVLPAQPINIALQSSTNVSCNGILGCANFNITGGSGIFTSFTLQYLDPSSQTLMTIMPANNNYYNICNLNAGLYYLTVKDSKNCLTAPYLFTIYDYSSLSIESITLDDSLCEDTPGKIRVTVNSLDPNLSFYYNNVLVPFVALGNNTYEASIDNPTVPNGIIKVKNGQNCWVTETVSTAIITPDFSFTSNDFQSYGYYSVNGSVQFTNLVNMSSIPAEYNYIVWDFGDNTPFKVFYNPEDLLPNAGGENFETVFHTYTTNGIYQITLTVYNQFGCLRTVTKTIIIGSGATMMLPTIFTPNNDGINDMFRPSLIGLKDVAMYIYDDWGNLVYEVSSDVSLLTTDWGWNGIEKGQSEPRNNDYRFYIIATTINDKKLEKEGRFLLVK